MPKIVIQQYERTSQYFIEDLGNDIQLEMMLIPGGTFIMGSPEKEEGSTDDERPQHPVTIKPFFMGKYQVTQEQWKAVAALPQVNRKLEPDPSTFKGVNRPVERVSWYDALEFCDRLAAHTKRQYRLPSEAEWEYACRAGTTTPFHFGKTISTDVANYRGTDNKEYNWSGSYGQGTKGNYRKQTTDVGSFKVANGFGVYDMHGNVWEWCLDDWHDNYEGAPTDGTAWKEENKNNQTKLLRGGSWYHNSLLCRSAYRFSYSPFDVYDFLGFRVVCSIPLSL